MELLARISLQSWFNAYGFNDLKKYIIKYTEFLSVKQNVVYTHAWNVVSFIVHIDEWVSFKLFTSLFHCLDCRANNNFDNKSVITNFSNLVCQFGFRMGYKLLCIKPVFMETIVFEARVEINFKNNVSTKGNCNSIYNGNLSST